MTKAEIKKRIYLTGTTHYLVHHEMPSSWEIWHTSNIKIGNAIVRALRELAYQENQK